MNQLKIQINAETLRMVGRAIADKRETREYLQYILADFANSRLIATDGHIMIEAPMRWNCDDFPGEVPANVAFRLDKLPTSAWHAVEVNLTTNIAVGAKPTHRTMITVGDPNMARNFPKYERVSARNAASANYEMPKTISFNASVLARVAGDNPIIMIAAEEKASKFLITGAPRYADDDVFDGVVITLMGCFI